MITPDPFRFTKSLLEGEN